MATSFNQSIDVVFGGRRATHRVVVMLLAGISFHVSATSLTCAQSSQDELIPFEELMNGKRPAGRTTSPQVRPDPTRRTLVPEFDPADRNSRRPPGFPNPASRSEALDADFVPPAERGPLTNTGVDLNSQTPVKSEEFQWRKHTTSIADLRFPTSHEFAHGDAFLTPQEEEAYLDLVNTIERQRAVLLKQAAKAGASSIRPVAVWEESFYQFANARRLAWNNGHLRKPAGKETLNGLADPFREADLDPKTVKEVDQQPYSLLNDIRAFPEDFVGRPVLLYGRLNAGSVVPISDDPQTTQASGRGVRKDHKGMFVRRAALRSLTDGRHLATIDFQNVATPDEGTIRNKDWAGDSIAVLVKGWVVKDWDSSPLIYSESVRKLSAIPHFELIRSNTFDKRRIQEEEKWLYYETLRQLELSSGKQQRLIADFWRERRINELMEEISQKAATDLAELSGQLQAGRIDEAAYRRSRTALKRRMAQRMARYRDCRKHPEKFQTYVDMFQYPEAWHGQMVSLSGHVRHVVSYPADEVLFPGRSQLHELWLFTDDSQHNPTVIVTPELPPDFPAGAEVIDSVSVTGCFFKRYVYGSQDASRIAPLLLAGRIQWEPTIDQVESLVENGHLAADSPRAKKAAELAENDLGATAMTLVCLFFVLVLMVLWGRAQREERDRVRLRKRIDEAPEFESPQLSGYPVGYSDLVSGNEDGRPGRF